jgi:hypothetical protein
MAWVPREDLAPVLTEFFRSGVAPVVICLMAQDRRRLLVIVVGVVAVVTFVVLFVARDRSPDPTTTTTTAAPTTPAPTEETVPVLLAPFSAMGQGWTEQVFSYGEGEEFLGTSPGGDGLMLGPEYGTQTPDGSWWLLDAASLRIAHFAPEGSYLDQVLMPDDLLIDGLYFQYQMPQGLDDGSVAAGGFREETTMSLLRVSEGEASAATFDGAVPLVTTDGELLYGFNAGDGAPHSLDPDDPVLEPVEWFLARDSSRYMVTVDQDQVIVELPDAGLTRTLQMRFSEDPDVVAHGGIEVESGADGTIFIMFYGAPTSDETLGIGGFVSVGADGQVGETEPIVDPFSMSDPGSPSHLGVTPGTSTPWIMVVGEDGVHVFTRTG